MKHRWRLAFQIPDYIHFEITGDSCNMIGSQPFDLFTSHTFFWL